MAIHIRDRETDNLVRKVAARTGMGITDSIRHVFAKELKQLDTEPSLHDRIQPIIDRIAARKRVPPPPESDKEFWDDMCGDP